MSILKKIFKLPLLPSSRPYSIILLAAIIAFLPVSFMLFSLKNDAIALDYPVKYFISQCLHHNIPPFWFNTWAMGFPIESVITWNVFSPLQLLWGGLFHYNVYTLHAEFIFYIAVAGCGMFYFLNKHISQNSRLNLPLAICYMLSGFTIGSSQWLIYVTAVALIPLVLASSFSFLKSPSIKSSLLFVAAMYAMMTSVYLAFTIITFYLLFFLVVYFLIRKQLTDKSFILRSNIIKYLFFAGLLMLVISSPALFYTFRVLQNIERGEPISSNAHFFNSNYIPLKGFISLLLPFSAPKIQAPNTEGTMMDLYIGLLPLLLLPASIFKNLREKNKSNYPFLLIATVFLVLSTGHLTPLRDFINILPGFSYFRNPGLFRLFFILFILIYLSATFSDLRSFYERFQKHLMVITGITMFILSAFFIIMAFLYYEPLHFDMQNIGLSNLKKLLNELTYPNLAFISACIQLLMLLLIFSFYRLKALPLISFIFIFDLVLNCLICTPFFTVSSYSVKQTNDRILQSTPGFPVQTINPAKVPTSIHLNNANWYNINVYQKKVSALNSYFGPLTLKNFRPVSMAQKHTSLENGLILFSHSFKTTIQITAQRPNYVSAFINTANTWDEVFFQQNFYKGWKACFNNQPLDIHPENHKMKVKLKGQGTIEFKYERTNLFIFTVLVNTLIFCIVSFYFLINGYNQFKKLF